MHSVIVAFCNVFAFFNVGLPCTLYFVLWLSIKVFVLKKKKEYILKASAAQNKSKILTKLLLQKCILIHGGNLFSLEDSKATFCFFVFCFFYKT